MGLFLVLVLTIIVWDGNLSNGYVQNHSGRPDVVNIGSILTLNSLVGKVAQVAIMAAVEDINSNASVLRGTKLNITALDSNSSGFLGITEAMRFMETETMAIIGPQSSVIAHVIAHIANELQVPLLSFAATDPTLSSLQYPFFVRTSLNDFFQMVAIAEIVAFYEWRAVIAVYNDDDFGRNGIVALADQLAARRCYISFKAPLKPESTRMDIQNILIAAALSESRIVVVHTYPAKGLDVLAVAQNLGMLDTGFVWITTNWLSTILDSHPLSSDSYDNVQGVITLRVYTPDSELKRNFISRWSNLTKNESLDDRTGLSTYALYAYDTVWLLARAIDAFFTRGGNVSFSRYSKLSKIGGGSLHLDNMKISNGGRLLLDSILHANMSGVTGLYSFASDRNLIHPALEVINVIGSGMRRIGYWSNYSGLSTVPPDFLHSRPPNRSSSTQELFPVIWPGQTTYKPRGWVFPNNGKQLKIGVLNRVTFGEFVTQIPGTNMFKGFSIDVFLAAINSLTYGVPYQLIPYGDGINNPSCTELVRLITTGVFDAAIGDIAITTNRTKMVDFTQPYIESGLVVVAPVQKRNSNAWAFLMPFTPKLWAFTAMFLIFVGVVVWIVEHRSNDEFRGPPKRQIVTILWFSLSTLFFAHRENMVSSIGRIVLVLWLFVVLIINSSYTASLTSILTVQQLSSPIKGIESLINSDYPIGYQEGSFARDYLIEQLRIDESRLIALNLQEDYEKALTDGPENGGVAAIVDQQPYMELFLSTRCEFSIVGQEFTRNGWGFAFPRDSPLVVDFSTAILKLSESGDIKRIHDKWLLGNACSSQTTTLEVDTLDLMSFAGLFFICGLVCIIALVIYFIVIKRKFSKHYSESNGSELSAKHSRSRSSRLRTFISFVDEKEEAVRARSERKHSEGMSTRSVDEDASMSNTKRYSAEITSNKKESFGDSPKYSDKDHGISDSNQGFGVNKR